MRIAVIADVHGNLRALDAVLADLAQHSPDITVNLGDCVSGPLDAAGTAERLMESSLVTIRGNHDRQLVDQPSAQMGESDRAALSRLSQRQLAWLAALPSTVTMGDVLLCHGTPSSDVEYLLERVTLERSESRRRRRRFASDSEVCGKRSCCAGTRTCRDWSTFRTGP